MKCLPITFIYIKLTSNMVHKAHLQLYTCTYIVMSIILAKMHCQALHTLTTAYEPPHDKTNKMTCAPSEHSDQPGHLPSLIRVFAVRMKKACVLSYPLSAQRRLRSDWADAQADMSLRWAHSHFVGCVMRRLIAFSSTVHTFL